MIKLISWIESRWVQKNVTRKAEEQVAILSGWGCIREKRWKMFEGRAVQAVLISLLSTVFLLMKRGGQNRYVRVFWIRCDVCGSSWLQRG